MILGVALEVYLEHSAWNVCRYIYIYIFQCVCIYIYIYIYICKNFSVWLTLSHRRGVRGGSQVAPPVSFWVLWSITVVIISIISVLSWWIIMGNNSLLHFDTRIMRYISHIGCAIYLSSPNVVAKLAISWAEGWEFDSQASQINSLHN